ncbi:hypothetical protein [Bacteroides caecigallinarum]|uniref:hypothetical protein n=1 Tax=Bacteroides caecigallinarum TaxID=1411144 RepID=UPI001F1EAC12|nr:hypothetical protein [Bacteroides caecigallinarum]
MNQFEIVYTKTMEKAFVYGVSVENENFTDRIKETKRLKLNFTNGLNTILFWLKLISMSVRKSLKQPKKPCLFSVMLFLFSKFRV